ncbi:hypothetical protein OCH239_10210 [Roseivivax halodurans JCM 10272]|uniref:Capsular polysaccharide biosynthesis protein n=1 Tax=Roseivivax halodurans JCM 10272 TaxID=1449350 RepID=X7ECA1_9RHOB|nr:hypothetical protein [Roseivivax halodurans]ETX13480.1 hypothetical protein OCH239_10210 [Roseivivax halodurans JCM 10272]
MKVLFYVEPHGIRDCFSEFRVPLQQMLTALAEIAARPGWEARLLCNPIMADVVLQEAPELWPLVLVPSPAERERMHALSISWDGSGMQRWHELMRDPGAEISRFYTTLLTRLRAEAFTFEAVVLWGENAAVRQITEAEDLVRVHLELASFRAPFTPALLMDPEGVNGAASTTRLEVETLPEAPEPEALLKIVHPKGDPRRVRAGRKGPTALVPLQLADDANLQLYSYYDSPAAFLNEVIPPLLAAGMVIHLKPHPGVFARGGEVWVEQDRALAPWRGHAGVEILPAIEAPSALPARIQAADLVVGINSSVLFETTLLGGIAVPMGTACFAPPGGPSRPW